MNIKYDFAVVGGGIAGLVTAELLTRSGNKVILIEKNSKLISGSSADQHGWFHLGSLYSASYQSTYVKKLIRSIDTLQEYYKKFPFMNIKIKNGKLSLKDQTKSWFKKNHLEYYVAARNNIDVFGDEKNIIKKFKKKWNWDLKCKLMIARHERIYRHYWGGEINAQNWIPKANLIDFKKRNIKKVKKSNINICSKTHFLLQSLDMHMDTYQITHDILQHFLSNGGKLLLGEKVDSYENIVYENENCKVIKLQNENVITKKIILSSGKGITEIVKSDIGLNTVASPLIVAFPALHPKGFVRVTPKNTKTINHLIHKVNGKAYSVIGGGEYANPDSETELEKIVVNLYKNASNTFEAFNKCEFKKHYFGLKNEISSNDIRNYGHKIIPIEENVIGIVPGKFTLGFNLGIDTISFLNNPTAKNNQLQKKAKNINVDHLLERPTHSRIAKEFILNNG